MSRPDAVVNAEDAPQLDRTSGAWGASYRVLTPTMRPRGGRLGVNRMCLQPGHATVPFHSHLREDEAFYVLSGRGVLRYGDTLCEIGPGDCVSCPAGTGTAHQIGNPFDEDLVYLAIGTHDPHEVCVYPDTGKVLVRGVGRIGQLDDRPYMDGEAAVPPVLAMWAARR